MPSSTDTAIDPDAAFAAYDSAYEKHVAAQKAQAQAVRDLEEMFSALKDSRYTDGTKAVAAQLGRLEKANDAVASTRKKMLAANDALSAVEEA